MGTLRDLLTGKVPGLGVPIGTGLVSPYAAPSVAIHEVVYADYFQGEIGEATRLAAMQIPAVSRARSILVSTIAALPLRAYDADGVLLAEQPAWLTSTSTAIPVWQRTAWTIDDLLFYGASLWTVARDASGTITDAARVPYELWSVDGSTGEIRVGGLPVPASEVLYIPGADEGLLVKGAPSIRGARAIERAWVGRAQNPIPLIELHQLTDEDLTDEEVDELLDTFAAGRTSPTGAVGFTDNRVEVRIHGDVTTDLFEGARNASVLDLARHTNMPAALLDGAQATASLTYVTTEGKRSEFWDFSVPYFTAPLEARLSQTDASAEGVAIRFDLSNALRVPQPDTAAVTDD